MLSFLDQLDAQLREVACRDPAGAAVRRPARAARRTPRRAFASPHPHPRARRVAVAVVAAASIGGTALAATGLWRPILGEPGLGSPPTISASSPPASQLDELGVLRRAQTAADRSAETEAELRYMSSVASGVRTDYVRLLSNTTGFGPAILVPVARMIRRLENGPPAVLARQPSTDALCLLVGDRDGEGSAKSCFTTGDVLDGGATLSLGNGFFGLAPDDVRLVTVTFGDGAARSATPSSNFFAITMPSGALPAAMTWVLASGTSEHFSL
jgi:hypothetical protein